MLKELAQERWVGSVGVVAIGATKEQGGSRSSVVKVGGQAALPFMFADGEIPFRPVIAAEVWDIAPTDWPPALETELTDVYADPVAWAGKLVNSKKVDLVCIRLLGAHPDSGNKTPDEEIKLLKNILKDIKVPLVVIGCGDDAKDNILLPACAEALKPEQCLLGSATQENYKTLAAACLADGHSIIAESPIDINIAKQLNILIHDMGIALDKIVINPTVGALGYGLEYAYSIMERARLAALTGDKMVAQPFICFVGAEAWRVKEAKATLQEHPEWGRQEERAILWEAITATAFLESGADIIVMRHPKAIAHVRDHIDNLMKGK